MRNDYTTPTVSDYEIVVEQGIAQTGTAEISLWQNDPNSINF